MKRIIIPVIILLIAFNESFSQTANQPLVFQSPEVSSLVREVTTPVSLSSGVVNVDIPIYNLKCGEIAVPISMSYDASGVKVDAQPTWVGQNWSLKAGGMISRIVKGAPDEAYVEEEIFLRTNGKNHITNKYAIGYLYNAKKLKANNWNTIDQIQNWAKNDYCELESDEFIFNFCGQTGKFYVNDEGRFVCSDKRYRIDGLIYSNIPLYDNTTSLNPNKPESFTYYKRNMMSNGMGGYIDGFVRWRVTRIMGFRITAPDGVQYYFGMYYKDQQGTLDTKKDKFEEVEITADFFSQFFEEEFSTWYLERIVSPKGDVVEFKYETGNPTASFSANYSVNKMSGSASSGFGWFFGGKVSASNFSAGQNLSGKFIRPVYLSEIRTPYEIVQFSRGNSNSLRYDYESFIHNYLNYIVRSYDKNVMIPVYTGQRPIISGYQNNVKVVDYNLLKTCKLNEITVKSLCTGIQVKDFKFSYNEGQNTRLQLLSITESDKNGKTLPPTVFKYNTTSLPGFLDIRNDHWGYYNNRMAKVDYTSSSSMTNYYKLKDADSTYTKAGILEEIIYPTGGTKKLIYEPNIYNRLIKRDINTGNLSIQPCSQTLGGGLRIKEIIENNGASSYSKQYNYEPGILNGEIQYYWSNYQGKLLNGNTYNAERFFTTSLLPVSNNSEGGSVSYSKVTEREKGNGRIEYTYSNHDNSTDENSVSIDTQKSPYSPLSSKIMERGKIKEICVYKEGKEQPEKKEIYAYSVLNNNPEYIKSVYIRRLDLFEAGQINAVEGSAYKIYIYPYNVEKKTEYFNYANGGSLQNEYLWKYDNFNQISAYTNINDGNSTRVETKYPYNYDSPVYKLMVDTNMIAPVIEKIITTKDNIEIERTKTNYSNDEKITNGKILPYTIQNSFSGSNDFVTVNTFDKYNKNGKLIQSTDKAGISTCYIWGYNGQYVVAEIKNATIDQIKNISGLNDLESKPLSVGLSALQNTRLRELNNVLVTTYNILPLVGIKNKIDPAGRKTTYHYDSFGRLSATIDDKGNIIQSYKYNYKK